MIFKKKLFCKDKKKAPPTQGWSLCHKHFRPRQLLSIGTLLQEGGLTLRHVHHIYQTFMKLSKYALNEQSEESQYQSITVRPTSA